MTIDYPARRSEMLNALTFDLEEYFQVEAFKAVVGFADWDGFPSRVTQQTIENAIGAPIFGYRAPTFSVVRQTLWALDILAEEGFTYDSSIFPIHHNRYGIPDAYRFPHEIPLTGGGSIMEFPMTTVAFAGQRLPFAGGGYFRLLPYAAIRAGLRHLNEHEKQPAIFYIHPWEIDPDQPRLSVSGLNRFRHYVNLRHTAGKLARLLDDFSFGPVRDVLSAYDLVVVPR
jgi:polysaccharide deacetylase family protein (PEP-CTERM system associated)